MIPAVTTAVAHTFRRAAVPLAAYYAVTLGLPLANGAAQSAERFADHALMVLAIPLLMIALACALRCVRHFTRAGARGVPRAGR